MTKHQALLLKAIRYCFELEKKNSLFRAFTVGIEGIRLTVYGYSKNYHLEFCSERACDLTKSREKLLTLADEECYKLACALHECVFTILPKKEKKAKKVTKVNKSDLLKRIEALEEIIFENNIPNIKSLFPREEDLF